MASLLIILLFANGFSVNSFIQYGYLPLSFKMVIEILIYLLFLFALVTKMANRGKIYDFHILPVFSFLLLIVLCSAIMNSYFNFKTVIALRIIFRFYIFYFAVINLNLTEKNIKIINIAIVIIFISQLPVSAIKFTQYGINERTIGTYATRGGGLTTIFPILVFGYMMGYYVYYKRKISYLLLTFGFILYGIAGAKRALIFIYPAFMILFYYLALIRKKNTNIAKHLLILSIIGAISFSFGIINLKYNSSLAFKNNRNVIKGKKMTEKDGLSYLIAYTVDYTKDSRLGGMFAAMEGVYSHGIPTLFFGLGPGVLSSSSFWNQKLSVDTRSYEVRNYYGTTGFSFILYQYGIMGLVIVLIIFFSFFRLCWQQFNYESDPYWKAFAIGSLMFSLLMVFDFIFYSTMCLVDHTILPVFFYSMGVVRLRFLNA